MQLSEAMYDLVAATLVSGPACSGTATSTMRMSGDSGELHNATVSAPLSRALRVAVEQVRAHAGLRNGDEQHAVEIRLRFVDRAHRRRGGGGEHVRVRLDEVLRVGRGVIGAAARTGHHRARRLLAQPGAEFAQQRRVVRELRAHHLGRRRRFLEHPRLGDHDDALSSATKS